MKWDTPLGYLTTSDPVTLLPSTPFFRRRLNWVPSLGLLTTSEPATLLPSIPCVLQRTPVNTEQRHPLWTTPDSTTSPSLVMASPTFSRQSANMTNGRSNGVTPGLET